MKKRINLFTNHYRASDDVIAEIEEKLKDYDFTLVEGYDPSAVLNLVVGGDGTFIRACHESNFSNIPFIGVNTGHLGFYQEIPADRVDLLIDAITHPNQKIQEIKLIEADVHTEENDYVFFSINEVVLKAKYASIIHFNMYVNDVLLQSFSGDGIIFSTPSGSTAYNLSAGGSILYQSLDGFQLTPIAPIRSSLFRSLDKSLVVPKDTEIKLITRKREETFSSFSVDGVLMELEDINYISIKLADRTIKKIVIDDNWYWKNIKDKFI